MECDLRYRDNFATTAILVDSGIALMRQNIKRQHPEFTDEQVDEKLSAWLYRTEDDVPGDTAGAVHVRSRAS